MAPRPRSLKVLFIGNSFTARNDVPGLIERLAAAQKLTFEHRLLSIGGASLRTHWNKGEAQREIRSGKYNYVVLQEQSTLPIKNAGRMHENIRLFDPVIRDAGAKTALYLTWARQHAPQTQQIITNAYTSIAREISAAVIPVGVAWQSFLSKHKKPVLHDKDKSHPTHAGSYLAACVFFRVLFKRDPAGTKPPLEDLSPSDIQLLEAVAAQM